MEERGFEVRDRRASLSEEKEASDTKTASQGSQPQAPPDQELLPVNFSSFILSLATSAMMHLGEEVNPEAGEATPHLPQARQVIDLISLLEKKTQGNLTQEESELISHILYTLRMKFVEVEKKR